MAVGEKTGGRQKGTPNKATADVIARLEALGCDPIEGMAQIAMDTNADLSLRGKMYAELAQYVAPKRKAVEHSGNDGGPVGFVLMGSQEAADASAWRQQHGPQTAD